MNRLLTSFVPLALLFCSCASDHYSAVHRQQIWPTAQGAVPDTGQVLPIYRTTPGRPYAVIGMIQFGKQNNDWRESDIAEAARIGRARGGEALIIAPPSELGFKLAPLASVDLLPSADIDPKILVIRWKTETQVAAENKIWDKLKAGVEASHPGQKLSDELRLMIYNYGAYRGLNLDSPKDFAALEKTVNELLDSPVDADGASTTHWLFHGMEHGTSLKTAFGESFYGVATVSQSRTNLLIRSDSLNGQFEGRNFFESGRLSGMVEIAVSPAVCQTQAEGSLNPERMVLDCRGENKKEMVRASFIFLR